MVVEEQRRQVRVRCQACERFGKLYEAWVDDDGIAEGDWSPVVEDGTLFVRWYTWDTERARAVGGYRQGFEKASPSA